MRKQILIAALVVLFLGCENKEYYAVVITNDSEKNVTFAYNDSTDTILAGENKIYEVKAYTQSPRDYFDQNGIESVNMKYENLTGNYIFINADYYNLNVTNEFPFDVTFSAGNFIDNGGSKSITVNTGGTNTSAKIYSKTPQFTSTLSWEAVFEFSISGNDMNVTIK